MGQTDARPEGGFHSQVAPAPAQRNLQRYISTPSASVEDPNAEAKRVRRRTSLISVITELEYTGVSANPLGIPELLAVLDSGAEIEETDGFGNTPLICAVKGNILQKHLVCDEIISVLLEAAADVNAKNADFKTPLMYACGAGLKHTDSDNSAVISMLIAAHADVQAAMVDGNTALMYTSRLEESHTGSTERMVRILLDAGADVHTRNRDGDTALNKAKDVKVKAVLEDYFLPLVLTLHVVPEESGFAQATFTDIGGDEIAGGRVDLHQSVEEFLMSSELSRRALYVCRPDGSCVSDLDVSFADLSLAESRRQVD